MRRTILMWTASAVVVTAVVLSVTASEHRAPWGPLASALLVSSAGPLTYMIRRQREIATRSAADDGVERAIAARAAAAVFRDLLVILPGAVLVLVADPTTSPVLLAVAVLVATLVDERIRRSSGSRAIKRGGGADCRLAEHRARLGLAEDELAARVSVSTRTIRAIEAGWHRPRVDLAVALAREVEAPVERLFPPPPASPG
ncbi:helix-turn-helix transcriptional regulator [Clavibacter nebraskensis]|uniref:helix-turn-helix transcriptional regulator n=1 Tax=Clavibacter nebraskensis TaxID=31963 RepID=UPI003F8802DD